MLKLHLRNNFHILTMCLPPFSFFWRLFGTNTVQQQLIKGFWPEAPDNVDAAYENTEQDRLLLIKGP